jgi:hypothetical protein
VAAHAGADAGGGELPLDIVGGAVVEPLGENGDHPGGRVVDEQVHVVGLAVELNQFGVQLNAHAAHDVLGEGGHDVGEHAASVLG